MAYALWIYHIFVPLIERALNEEVNEGQCPICCDHSYTRVSTHDHRLRSRKSVGMCHSSGSYQQTTWRGARGQKVRIFHKKPSSSCPIRFPPPWWCAVKEVVYPFHQCEDLEVPQVTSRSGPLLCRSSSATRPQGSAHLGLVVLDRCLAIAKESSMDRGLV